ncbi:hypothetical protein MMUC44124_03090 [Mycolicibacterium mucogenicum DSM 44124]|nr:hypothetical protein MMUC44124_03090 [Mycolicibacterium mucogenicum DSM 44124]
MFVQNVRHVTHMFISFTEVHRRREQADYRRTQ